MTQSVIGALRVTLGLDNATWEEGLTKAQMSINAAFAKVQKSMAVFGVAAAAGFGVVTAEVLKTVNALGDLEDAAQKAGASAENMARLKFAAEVVGVEFETLQGGILRLNRAIVASDTATSGAGETLRRLGITSKTDTVEALKIVADEFQRLPDGAQKASLAVEIFGKQGTALIPLLNEGSAGIAELAAEAERLGVVIDTQTVAAAGRLGDDLARLQKVKEGVTLQITAGMVPALSAMADALIRSLAAGKGWQSLGKGLGEVLLVVAEAALGVYEAISAIVNAIRALGRAAQRVAAGDFAGAVDEVQTQEFRTQEAINRRRATFARIRADIANFRPGEVSGPSPVPALEALPATSRQAASRRDEPDGTDSDSSSRLSREFQKAIATPIAGAGKSASAALEDVGLELQDLSGRFEGLTMDLSSGLSGALAAGITGTRDLKQAFTSVLQDIGGRLIQQFIQKPFENALGGLVEKGLGALFNGFAGGFATGGLIPSGQWGVVGEEGPELAFASGAGMRVFSNRQSAQMLGAGAGNGITVNVNGVSDPGMVRTYARLGAAEALAAAAQGMRPRRPKQPGGMG